MENPIIPANCFTFTHFFLGMQGKRVSKGAAVGKYSFRALDLINLELYKVHIFFVS